MTLAKAEHTLNISVKNPWVMLKQYWERLTGIVNGSIGFGDGILKDNLDLAWANAITPGVANTDFVVVHNLRRLPVGYVVAMKNASVDIYTGSASATTTQLTLRATVVGVAIRLMIF